MKIIGVIFFTFFTIHISTAQNVAKLVDKNKFQKAEETCEDKACYNLKNDEYFECYRCIAEEHFKKNNLDLAFKYFKIMHSNEGIIKVGNAYINTNDFENAYICFNSINYSPGIEKIGDIYFGKSDYNNALKYYELSDSKENVIKVGDIFLSNGEYEKAYNCYNMYSYLDGIIKIGTAYLNNNDITKALMYYDMCNYNKGIGNVVKMMLKDKKVMKLEINANYPNANENLIDIPIYSTTKKVLSLAGFQLKKNDDDSVVLKVTFDAYARKSEKYQGLYCGAEVAGNIELVIKDRKFYRIPFQYKKFNYHSDFIWLDYEGQYTSPNHAPFESTFFDAYLPKLLLLLANISDDEFLLKALNNKRKDNIRCAAIYAIGENNLDKYLPNLINLLKVSQDWDFKYNNLAIDEIYMALEAVRKITNGDYFNSNASYCDSIARNHQYRKDTFFNWWNHYQSQVE